MSNCHTQISQKKDRIEKLRKQLTSETKTFKSGDLYQLFELSKEQPEFILEPFIREGEASLIYAASGLGKSFYACGLAVAIASGGSYLGYSAPKSRKVKYIDGEMSVNDLAIRVRSAITDNTDMGVLYQNLLISNREAHTDGLNSFPDIADSSVIRTIVGELIADQVEVVIFDNFSTLALGVEDENSAGSFNSTLELILALKSVGVLPILVHHSNKNGTSYRGTSKIEAIFSNIIGLVKDKSIDLSKGCGFTIRFDKNRSMHSDLTEARTVQYDLELEEWIDLESECKNIDELLAALTSLDYISQKEIAEALGRSEAWVTKWMKKAIAVDRLTEAKRRDLFRMAGEIRDNDEERDF